MAKRFVFSVLSWLVWAWRMWSVWFEMVLIEGGVVEMLEISSA